MTELQSELLHRMITGDCYLVIRKNFHRTEGFMLYQGHQNPVKWYSTLSVRPIWRLLKRDKKKRYTLHLNQARQLRGNTRIKRLYKLHKAQTVLRAELRSYGADE